MQAFVMLDMIGLYLSGYHNHPLKYFEVHARNIGLTITRKVPHSIADQWEIHVEGSPEQIERLRQEVEHIRFINEPLTPA